LRLHGGFCAEAIEGKELGLWQFAGGG